MKNMLVAISIAYALAAIPINVMAEEVMAVTADEITWLSNGALAKDGIKQANLIGAPDKPGPYTVRLSFPAGYKLLPHTHPDSRHITVLKGTWMTGYGKTFDAKLLKVLPAGSFYTEPADLPHFVVVTEDVIIQVSGTGPSGRKYLPENSVHTH